MNQKGITLNSGKSPLNGMNSNNTYSIKQGQNNIIPHKKFVNAGKMILNPIKLQQEKQNHLQNQQYNKVQNVYNRPTTTAIIKEETNLLSLIQGKAILLNTTKLALRENTHSSHQNKVQTQNQSRKYQPSHIQEKQTQQHQQQIQIKQMFKEKPIKVESQTPGYYQQQQQQQQQQQSQYQQQFQQNKQQNQDSTEGLTLDEYFKVPQNMNQQSDQEFQKLFSNPFVMDKKITQNNSSQSDRNVFSSGVVYDGNNDDEFFGFMKTEEINIEQSIYELKNKKQHLSFDLLKSDLDDIKFNPAYEEFTLEIIIYLQNIFKINKIDNKYKDQLSNQPQIKTLQYFVFNGIEDCLYSRDLNIQLICELQKDINTYPSMLIETFCKRIENKFFMIEETEKMNECFKLILKYLQLNSFQNEIILNSIIKFIKLKRLRDILIQFLQSQKMNDLLNNETTLILLFTLKNYQSLPQEFKLPQNLNEKHYNNKLLNKLFKYNQKQIKQQK